MEQLNKEQAINVITTWIALEVLSPQKDLAKEEAALIADCDRALPWENGGEEPFSDNPLYYQVTIGAVDLKAASKALIKKYGDKSVELPSVSGKATMAVAVVDAKGYLVKSLAPVSTSSFAWGVPQALQGNTETLWKWVLIEKDIADSTARVLNKKDKEGQPLPLTKETLNEAYRYLLDFFGIPVEMCSNETSAIRSRALSKKIEYSPKPKSSKGEESIPPSPPSPLLINSFYLSDLVAVRTLIEKENVPQTLSRYLGLIIHEKRHNIFENNPLLENMIAPHRIPSARWPGPGRHSLVLLQQAAVNLAASELKEEGVLAVNGPPGTGKTTLLRDIVANVICKRAEALLKFDDPTTAFKDSGYTVKAGQGKFRLYAMDESLHGFEIVIASSNNKAVENVSAELPSLNAIASDASELRYFDCLSDKLSSDNTWGLISAVLGNSRNCNFFRETFWWNKDCGIATYLGSIDGISPQRIKVEDEATRQMIEGFPKIILENDPPRDHQEALTRWGKARQNFSRILNQCTNRMNELEAVRKNIAKIEILKNEFGLDKTLDQSTLLHKATKPNFIFMLCNTAKAKQWKEKNNGLLYCLELEKKIGVFYDKVSTQFIDSDFFSKPHEEIHQTTPWCDAITQALRDEVFIASIKLSKAFIDAAAKPLRHNIGILMQSFGKQSDLPDENILRLMPDLWASFFLVVPSISTTFASVNKMFKHIKPNVLGWLLIDEAGQALPQAAVGAILRSKRVVVTGDPMQIEPVVTLPRPLVEEICAKFTVDVDRFTAPNASAQTLADAATPYFAEFHALYGSRKVGFPLLVHRRCADPMFSISNVIAYERLMVKAKPAKTSLIRNCLGNSVWFNIQGEVDDKWCPQEGEKVLELLTQLKNAGVYPDIYIITPFRMVANQLHQLIAKNGILAGWSGVKARDWLSNRIGTVHVVQGREAEAVFLVLGAPAIEQKNTRAWAGSAPNILNVAVTRAKEALYVIGNKEQWKDIGVFKELYDNVEVISSYEPKINDSCVLAE